MVEFLYVLAWFGAGFLFNVLIFGVIWWKGEDITGEDLQMAIFFLVCGPFTLVFLLWGIWERLSKYKETIFIPGRRSARVFRDLRGEFDDK